MLATTPQVRSHIVTEGREMSPLEMIFELAKFVGAEIEGPEDGYPDHPPRQGLIIFTEAQLEKFATKLLDGSWVYKGFEFDAARAAAGEGEK